jgi:putative heme-binding domain-containing protein
LPALVLAQRLQSDRQPELLAALNSLTARLASEKVKHRHEELKQAVHDALYKTAAAHPNATTWDYLVRGLESRNPVLRAEVLAALRKLDAVKPKTDDPRPYRTLLLAAASWQAKERWQAVELLRQWNGRSFGAPPGKPDKELEHWGRWFAQTFPKEPALPNVAALKPGESKYRFDELRDFLDSQSTGKNGDPARGRIVFEKAQCAKCHKFGKDGEGLGPDLTTLSKRFKRSDTLEAILYPSKVISDQYRSVTITTTSGVQITGLAAFQGDMVTVLLPDASKVTLKRSEIEHQVASLVSVMPDRLLDPLTRREIADLFAFLESEPK